MPGPAVIPIAAAAGPSILSVASAVFSGIGALSSILGGSKADKAAKKAAKKEAALEGMVTQEKIRQLGIEERVYRGETRAAVAGSGVKVNVGSPLQILAESARGFAMQKDITQRVGATKASAALQRGQMIGTQAKYGSYASAANQFGQMFSILGGP